MKVSGFSRPVTMAAVGIVGVAIGLVLVVPGSSSRAVVTVDRFGDGVRLLPEHTSLSFLPLARRVLLQREDGAAVLESDVTLPLSGGATLPVRLRLQLTGSGPLPVDAASVRRSGLPQAVAEAVRQRLELAPDEVAAVLGSTPLWKEIFPSAGSVTVPDLTARLKPVFAPLELAHAELVPRDAEAMVRAAARSRLRGEVNPRGRLVLLGLDALDWSIVDELTGNGTMPNLARLLKRGQSADEHVPQPLISPVVWTTIATGVPPEVHGVLDFLEPDPGGGPPRPVSAASRKAPALWEMAAAAGRTSAVIGWWATFPARAPAGGAVYSDRLTEQLLGLQAKLPGLADPPQADAAARRLALHADDVTPEMLAPFAHVSAAELADVLSRKDAWDDPIGGLAKLVAATLTVERLTDHELQRGTDVVLSYLEGTDTVGHLYGAMRPPAMSMADPATARRFGGVVDRYYAHVDSWIGHVASQLGPADTLVIVSDHGFVWDDRPRVAAGAHTATAVMWHRPIGFFFAMGPGVPMGGPRKSLNVIDVTPAILELAGLPQGTEMPGHVPDWLFSTPPAQPAAVQWAALLPQNQSVTIDLPPEARAEELAKLRALGYLAGGDIDSGAAPVPAAPTPAAEPETVAGVPPAAPEPAATRPHFNRAEARRLNNLAISRAGEGDTAGAEKAFREAIAADPTYASAYYSLGILLRKADKLDESDRMIWEAVRTGVRQRELVVVQLALDYRQRGDAAKAREVLALGRRRLPESATIWLNSGVMAGEDGDFADSRTFLEEAVALDPSNPAGFRNLGVALLSLGDREGARRALAKAVELQPDDAATRRQLEILGGPPGR